METLVPVDPVTLARTWLTAPGRYPWPVQVVKNRPRPVSGRVVTVRRVGGGRPDLVTDAAWLAVECFAPTDLDAAALGHVTWGLLFAMRGELIDGVQCYRVQAIAGPADFPDADASQPRFTLTVQATFRTAPL